MNFQVYEYYAAIEREREANAVYLESETGSPYTKLYRKLFSNGKKYDTGSVGDVVETSSTAGSDSDEKKGMSAVGKVVSTGDNHLLITTRERDTGEWIPLFLFSQKVKLMIFVCFFVAYRALRTASWQGVFFLITTDILG